jgi:hypothetical protein
MERLLSDNLTKVGFRIYYPGKNLEYDDEFCCHFETFGLEDNISGGAIGSDAISSLINAMMRVDIFLKTSRDFQQGRIKWVGGLKADDFGLPWESANKAILP